ncbi:NIL domain-containing protein [Alkalinema pantanalense CENA528]|uniref:NIL domain-containing protein n=1 Tax=Alkalinema pantanalense TaxID=1620705 RepID=UPI003D6E6F33
MQHSIRIQIPQTLHQEPVIYQLITDYDLMVNIKAAILDQKARGGGWFDLMLEGEASQIRAALEYLDRVGVEIWNGSLSG